MGWLWKRGDTSALGSLESPQWPLLWAAELSLSPWGGAFGHPLPCDPSIRWGQLVLMSGNSLHFLNGSKTGATAGSRLPTLQMKRPDQSSGVAGVPKAG